MKHRADIVSGILFATGLYIVNPDMGFFSPRLWSAILLCSFGNAVIHTFFKSADS